MPSGPVKGRWHLCCVYLYLVNMCHVINGYNYDEDVSPSIYSLRPTGVRVSITGHPALSEACFHANINEPIKKWNHGDIDLELRYDGKKWIAENPHVALKGGDIINYWMHVKIGGKGELLEGRSYIPHSSNQDNSGGTRLAIRQNPPTPVEMDSDIQISDSKENLPDSLRGINSFFPHRHQNDQVQSTSSLKTQPFYNGQTIQSPIQQYIDPSQTSFINPSQGTFINPSQNGFTSSQTGFINPSQPVLTNPLQTGLINPSQTSFTTSQSDFINPNQPVLANPSQTGFTNPTQSVFTAPQTGFTNPTQTGFINPSQTGLTTSQTGFINPSQTGLTTSQTGFINPSQTGLTTSQTGFINPSQTGLTTSQTGFINQPQPILSNPSQNGFIPSQTGFTNPSQNGFPNQSPNVVQIPVIIPPVTTKPSAPVFVPQTGPTLSNVPLANYQNQHPPDRGYTNCEESETTVNGRPACKEHLIFFDTFNYYNSTVWSYDMEFPSLPDSEFCVFTGLADNSRIGEGSLKIWPTLTDDKYGKDFVLSGRLDLPDCTSTNADRCGQEGEFAYILPPTMSARYSTRGKWSFKYGRVDIVAKVARGDWLYPEFWLAPADRRANITKRLEIAVVRGNTHLKTNRGEEIGAKALSVGALVPTASGNDYLRKEFKLKEPNNRFWTDDFHTFSLLWTEDAIAFSVDGIEIGVLGPRGQVSAAMFHQEMSLVIGLGVGGVRVFPDTRDKPWTNTEPKAMYKFWAAKDHWYKTWSRDANTMIIREVRITSL